MGGFIDDIEGPEDRAAIERIHARALELVPDAVEGTGYGMPALVYRGRPLVSVRVAKAHIGYYPFSPAVVDAVHEDLDAGGFDWSKGTVRFSAGHPLPDDLVDRLILLRRDEIAAATGAAT
ncbi:iron chaperone [Agromyces sp. MMS24-JH15]|uniref:iron chaperone n=1 Tax=Agromyces sp. MMS24-JH15 TaxID=3243765 RepID=UPI003747B225